MNVLARLSHDTVLHACVLSAVLLKLQCDKSYCTCTDIQSMMLMFWVAFVECNHSVN